jgi:hypothetical protein
VERFVAVALGLFFVVVFFVAGMSSLLNAVSSRYGTRYLPRIHRV